jgi:hypothetical protein
VHVSARDSQDCVETMASALVESEHDPSGLFNPERPVAPRTHRSCPCSSRPTCCDPCARGEPCDLGPNEAW